MRKALALGAGALLLVLANWAVFERERQLAEGRVVLLELAPVDPRSLMQGDYMALRFQLAERVGERRTAGRGDFSDDFRIPLQLDARRVASLGTAADALRLRYRIRNREVWLGTNAYFFEEGSAERYTAARFGEFRLDRTSGEAILVGLCDAQLRRL